MASDQQTDIVRGTANLFEDLGYADSDIHLLKTKMVSRIQQVITAQKLTPVMAAKHMGLNQQDVSQLLNGQFRDVSVERLMRLLTQLRCDVVISIRQHGEPATTNDTIHFQAVTV